MCRTACASISAPASASVAASFARRGQRASTAYRAEHPDLADQLEQMQKRELPDGWDADLPSFPADAKGLASRDSSAKVLNAIAAHYPWLIGGSADLAPSTKTRLTFEAAGDFEADKYGGRNLHFGIREHAMGAILNGLALSKIRAYGSTFLIFSDYMKPRHPPERADGAAGHLRLHPRFDRPGPGRPDAPAGRAARRACARSPASSRCALPTPTRSSRPGASSSG